MLHLFWNDGKMLTTLQYYLDTEKIKIEFQENLNEFVNIINEWVIEPFKEVYKTKILKEDLMDIEKNKKFRNISIIFSIIVIIIAAVVGGTIIRYKQHRESIETNIFDNIYYNYRKLINIDQEDTMVTYFDGIEYGEEIDILTQNIEIIHQGEKVGIIGINKSNNEYRRVMSIGLYNNDGKMLTTLQYYLDTEKIKIVSRVESQENLNEFVNIINEWVIEPFKEVYKTKYGPNDWGINIIDASFILVNKTNYIYKNTY